MRDLLVPTGRSGDRVIDEEDLGDPGSIERSLDVEDLGVVYLFIESS